VRLYHLAGRDTANPDHPDLRPFALQFARLSPYAVIEVLEFSDAQTERFLKAYDIAKAMLRELGIFPARGVTEQERLAVELDEFDRGYPRLTLQHLMDVVAACLAATDKQGEPAAPRSPDFQGEAAQASLKRKVDEAKPSHAVSWAVVLGRLARLNRLRVFDTVGKPMSYKALLQPGQVSVIDLSDTESPALSNLVIADVLRGVQEAQDEAYEAFERARREGKAPAPPTRVLLVVEEAHEFLSAERQSQMPVLFQQVARIAKRGRKRWLGLVFVTQLPQHLPRQLFGLVNSYVLHKISDPQVVSTLERTVPGIDAALWRRLAGLAPGQAIVAFPHLARPLLVAVDPAQAQLRLVD
jgi:hypothetical protein